MSSPNYPIEMIAIRVAQHKAAGHKCYQKFTCSHCGSRQTMEVPNVLYATGRCEECDKVTDITKTGCNYAVGGPVNSVMAILKQGRMGESDH